MIRRLFPLIEWGRWDGSTLSDPSGCDEQVEGWSFVFQWLGLLVEIGAGRVERTRK